MKKGLKVENVEVMPRSTYIRDYGSLSCTCDGARYHVWMSFRTMKCEPVLYKNPPHGTKSGDPGHYWTRKLAIGSRFGSWLIGEMIAQAKAGDLFAKAETEAAERVEAAKKQAEAEAAAARVRAAAPDLLAALQMLYAEYVVDLHGARTCDCDPSVGITQCAPCYARAAIRLATTKEVEE